MISHNRYCFKVAVGSSAEDGDGFVPMASFAQEVASPDDVDVYWYALEFLGKYADEEHSHWDAAKAVLLDYNQMEFLYTIQWIKSNGLWEQKK